MEFYICDCCGERFVSPETLWVDDVEMPICRFCFSKSIKEVCDDGYVECHCCQTVIPDTQATTCKDCGSVYCTDCEEIGDDCERWGEK